MVEILNFKKGATITKLNATVINLYVWGILMPDCGRDNMEYIPHNWLIFWLLRSELLTELRAGQIHKF
jgi:hypothetical protein